MLEKIVQTSVSLWFGRWRVALSRPTAGRGATIPRAGARKDEPRIVADRLGLPAQAGTRSPVLDAHRAGAHEFVDQQRRQRVGRQAQAPPR